MSTDSRLVLRTIARLLWGLWAVLGMGFLTWVAFLVPGFRMRNRLWLTIGFIYAALAVVLLVLAGAGSQGLGATVFGITWISGMGLFAALARGWVKWSPIANGRHAAPSMTSRRTSPIDGLIDTSQWLQPNHAGHEVNDAPASSDDSQTGSGLVDVNAGTEAQLSKLSGLTPSDVAVILHERSVRGPFTDVDDFFARVPLQPHIAVRLRAQITVRTASSGRSGGRIVDI